MADDGRPVSDALLKAQKRLEQLRLFAQTKRPFPQRSSADLTKQLPDHLGWGTEQVTAVLRQTTQSVTNLPENDNWIATVQVH